MSDVHSVITRSYNMSQIKRTPISIIDIMFAFPASISCPASPVSANLLCAHKSRQRRRLLQCSLILPRLPSAQLSPRPISRSRAPRAARRSAPCHRPRRSQLRHPRPGFPPSPGSPRSGGWASPPPWRQAFLRFRQHPRLRRSPANLHHIGRRIFILGFDHRSGCRFFDQS